MGLITHSANLITLFQSQSWLRFDEVKGIYCECCIVIFNLDASNASLYITTLADLWCCDVITEFWSL